MVSAFLNLLSLLLLCQKGRWGSKSILISQNFLSHQVSEQNLLCHWKSCLLNVISLNLLATFFNIHEFILYSTKHTVNVLEQIYTGNYHGKLWPMPPKLPGIFLPKYANANAHPFKSVCVSASACICGGGRAGHF